MLKHPSPSPAHTARSSERGSSMVEYVGLGALSTMLVSGLVAAADSAAADRLGAAVVKRLIEAITNSG